MQWSNSLARSSSGIAQAAFTCSNLRHAQKEWVEEDDRAGGAGWLCKLIQTDAPTYSNRQLGKTRGDPIPISKLDVVTPSFHYGQFAIL
jgi:hypothetical protein